MAIKRRTTAEYVRALMEGQPFEHCPNTRTRPMKPEDVPADLVEVAAAALFERSAPGFAWERDCDGRFNTRGKDAWRRDARAALAAVLPKVAGQIRAVPETDGIGYADAWQRGFQDGIAAAYEKITGEAYD